MESMPLSARNSSDTRARRTTASAGEAPDGVIGSPDAMFRLSKSGRQLLEQRYSDSFEQAEGSAFEWEGEPIMNLVTAVLGAGVLGFPFCFKTCGMALAVVLVLVTLPAAELSMRLLLMSSQLTGKRSYEELARHSYGRAGQVAVDSCIIAMNVGSVVAYLNILTDTISSVAGTIIPPGAEPSRNMMLGVVTMAGCLPVALLVKNAQLLAAVNSVSMVFILFFCCITALLPFSPTPNTGSLQWWRWDGVLVAFPVVSYGFTVHHYLFTMYPASQRPSMRKMTVAVQRGMLLSAVVYVVVGACGYSAFGNRTAGDVLRNFGGVGASGVRLTAERVLKYGFGVSLLGTIPLTVIPLHATFAPWLALCSPAYATATKKEAEEAASGASVSMPLSQLQGNLLTAAILGASYAMAVLLPNVEFVFGLAGSTASTLVAFILPPSIFLTVTSGQRGMMGYSVDMPRSSVVWKQRRRMAGALLVFGCVAGVLCTHALVVSIQEEHEVVQLAQELVREETKAAAAVQTEQKAKQVAEAVEMVARVAQEVDAAQAQATGQAETLARAAQALNDTATGPGNRKKRQQQKEAASSELALAHSEADQAVQKLKNVTATLGATASRLRNDSASSRMAADGGSAAARGQAVQAEQQAQSSSGRGTGSDVGKSSVGDGAGSRNGGQVSAHSGESHSTGEAALTKLLVRIEDALPATQQGSNKAGDAAKAGESSSGSSSSSSSGGTVDDDVAQALEKVASTANETLAAVKQSKVALEAAAAEASTSRKSKAKAGHLGKAISDALNATAEAAAKLNATSQALKAVEQEKTSELLTMITKLAEQEEKEAKEEEAKQQYDQHTLGRKEGLGFTAATLEAAAAAAAEKHGGGGAAGAAVNNSSSSSGAGSNSTLSQGLVSNTTANPRQEVREVLKQVASAAASSAGNGSAVNVTQMAQAAIEAASTVVASSKDKVEQTIEKKKPKITVRAIEIAKELHSSGRSEGSAAGATNVTISDGDSVSASRSSSSIIEAAAVKHEEVVSRQKQQANTTAAVSPATSLGSGAASTR